MGHRQLVVIPGDATTGSIQAHPAAPLRALPSQQRIGDRQPGGQATGAGDPDDDPAADPANWRPCATCGANTRLGRAQCTDCADAEQAAKRRLPKDRTQQ
jgi:hypothetical protein